MVSLKYEALFSELYEQHGIIHKKKVPYFERKNILQKNDEFNIDTIHVVSKLHFKWGALRKEKK